MRPRRLLSMSFVGSVFPTRRCRIVGLPLHPPCFMRSVACKVRLFVTALQILHIVMVELKDKSNIQRNWQSVESRTIATRWDKHVKFNSLVIREWSRYVSSYSLSVHTMWTMPALWVAFPELWMTLIRFPPTNGWKRLMMLEASKKERRMPLFATAIFLTSSCNMCRCLRSDDWPARACKCALISGPSSFSTSGRYSREVQGGVRRLRENF